MPPRASGGANASAVSDPMYLGNLWTMVQMVMARGCMLEDDARREFARITGKPATDLFDQAMARENIELGRLSLALRRVVSPLTGRAHVGLANLSADAPAKAVGSRYSHAQREFFARVLEVIATDPNATNGVCSAPVTRLLNLDLSLPSSIGAGMAAAAAPSPTAATPTKGGKGKGKGKTAAVKRNPQSDDADGSEDAAAGGAGGANGQRQQDEDAAALRAVLEDDAEAQRRAAAAEAARLAADAVRRMSLREREETLNSLAHEGWLELRQDLAGHYCVGPRSFLELSTYLLKMDVADSTRDRWDGIVG